ncbi:MAG TPA: right-handed parallel beta-helix repeat-containing protein, partial [Verrucomicrobiae bacterium]|nr:right-handed parallel beta-helix repeat-containing protein [Verrucomicrobiae bacterium]
MIDGTTQPGYAGTPVVELNGSAAGVNANGLYLAGGSSTVQGLLVDNFGGSGIVLDVNGGNVIQNDYIGTDATGTQNLGNSGAGVAILAGSGNLIGGNTNSAGNVIAFNNGAGVAIVSGSNNLVRYNAIFSNTGLAIDLGNTGTALPNHLGNAVTGPNNFQNYPVLGAVAASGAMTGVHGSLNSAANTSYQLDFYYSPSLDSAGFGDGKYYLGSSSVTTDTNGNAGFHSFFQASIPNGSYISAV